MPGLKGRLYTFIQSALTLLLLTYFVSVDRACTLLTFIMVSTIASLQFGSAEACAWTPQSYGHLIAVVLLQLLPGRVPSSIACLASAALCASAYLGLVRIWLPSPPIRLDGWVVVVTGSSAGIGLETARHLLRLGATVVFACRTEARARGDGRRARDDGRAVGQGRLRGARHGRLRVGARLRGHVQEGYRPRPRRRAGVQRRRDAPAAQGVGARLGDELWRPPARPLFAHAAAAAAAAHGGGRGRRPRRGGERRLVAPQDCARGALRRALGRPDEREGVRALAVSARNSAAIRAQF